MALKNVGVKLVVEGGKGFKASMQKAEKTIGGFAKSIQRHRKAIGLAIIGMGVAALGAAAVSVKAFAKMGDEVQKMALRTGFATETLSEFRHVAELSGTSLTSLEKGIKKMSKTLVDASEGLQTYIRSFDRIGLSAEELIKLSPEEQFTRITTALAALENPTLRAATAQEIFGRAGTELLPILAQGAEGIAKLRQEAHDLGIVFDQEAANAAAELLDNMTRLSSAIKGLQFVLAKEFLPALEAIIPTLTEMAKIFGPILEKVFNWHAEYDRGRDILKKYNDVQLQLMKLQGGIANTYFDSLAAYVAVLEKQEDLTDANIRWIEQSKKLIQQFRQQTSAVKISYEEQAIAAEDSAERQIGAMRRVAEGILGPTSAFGAGAGGAFFGELFGEADTLQRTLRIIGQLRQAGQPVPENLLRAREAQGGARVPQSFKFDIDGRRMAEAVADPLGEMTLERDEVGP